MHPSKCNWDGFYHIHKGGAIPTFRGIDYQLGHGQAIHGQGGHGAFTNWARHTFLPLLGKAGKTLLRVGRDWVKDVAVEGQDPKEALKRRALSTAQDLVNQGFEKVKKKMNQSGSGRRKKKVSAAQSKKRKTRPKSSKKGQKKKKKTAKRAKNKTAKQKKKGRKVKGKKGATKKRSGVRRRRKSREIIFAPTPTTDIFG